MNPQPSPQTPDEYADWLQRRIGAEVRRRRAALGLSAYALARAAGVSDQAILNLEQGRLKQGCTTGTLARIARRLGTRFCDFVLSAECGAGARDGE